MPNRSLTDLTSNHRKLAPLFEEYAAHVRGKGRAAARLRGDLGKRISKEISIHTAVEEQAPLSRGSR